MGYTADELVERFRRDVDDNEGGSGGEDFLWSDEDVFSYMYEAQREFVRRTHILRKTHPFTPAITSISYTAPVGTPVNSDGFITFNPSIIRPLRVRATDASGNSYPVEILTAENLDAGYHSEDTDYGRIFTGDWPSRSGTRACFLVTDLQEDQWRLVPIPTLNLTLELTVEHMPLDDVTQGAALEVTEREDQFTLLLYMKHLAYMKQDADTYDKELADKFESTFEKKADARRREIRRTRFRHQGMRYGGIRF
jgi:hypothetical protein